MNHYHYQKQLKTLWSAAVAEYEKGNRDPASYFDAADLAELEKLGPKSDGCV
jgi:hypothetical protein